MRLGEEHPWVHLDEYFLVRLGGDPDDQHVEIRDASLLRVDPLEPRMREELSVDSKRGRGIVRDDLGQIEGQAADVVERDHRSRLAAGGPAGIRTQDTRIKSPLL